MVCVHCGGKTAVTNSRYQVRNNQVWRRRRCTKCGSVFTTSEQASHSAVWLVSKNKQLSSFSRDKLLISLHRSCLHRSTAIVDSADLTDTIIKNVRRQVADGVLDSNVIAQTAFVALNRFDKAAGTHYQAFHRL